MKPPVRVLGPLREDRSGKANALALVGFSVLRPGLLPPCHHLLQNGQYLAAIIIAENFEVLSLGPQNDRGMPVPTFEGHAGVARITLELLLGLDVSERFRVQEFVFLNAQLPNRQAVPRAVAPVFGGQAGLEDFSHLMQAVVVVPFVLILILVLVFVVPATMASIAIP